MIGSTWESSTGTDPGKPGSPRYQELRKLAKEIWDRLADFHMGMEDISLEDLEIQLNEIITILGKARIVP